MSSLRDSGSGAGPVLSWIANCGDVLIPLRR